MDFLFFNQPSESAIKQRIYSALVKRAILCGEDALKTKIRMAVFAPRTEGGDVFLSSYLDALRLLVAADDFSDFMTTF